MSNDTETTDLLSTLERHRGFLRQTIAGLADEQLAARPTVSALCLGGIIKHVGRMEAKWVDFIQQGPEVMAMSEAAMADHVASFEVGPDDSAASLLAEYDRIAARTAEVVATLPNLDVAQPLPPAPWFEPGATWTARRVLVHIVAETAQHAGHADIIRETIDGARTMG